jgi:trigger factor
VSEFKNENLTVKVEKSAGSNVKLEISISPKATESAYLKALKNINHEIVIPGFRKGKAPKNLILEKFKSQIDEEWKSVLLNTAFQEALQMTNLLPLSQNSVKPQIKTISTESGSEIIIAFESRPEIPEINPSKITLKKTTPEIVTQEQIDDRLHELQLNQATWENIEGRGIQDEDYITLNIESLDNPGTVICTDETFIVSKTKIGKWLYNLLIGKNINDTFEGTSEKDECKKCDDDSHVHPEEPEFKPSKLQITVKSIKKPTLPEINAEFATKLGAESVETLKERVIQSLEKNAKDSAQADLRDQISDIIESQYTFDIPASIVKKHNPENDQMLSDIENSYRMYFITQKIAHENNLSVSENEIMEEFMVQAYMTNPKESIIDPSVDPKEIHHRIESYLLERKVKDYLIEHANQE